MDYEPLALIGSALAQGGPVLNHVLKKDRRKKRTRTARFRLIAMKFRRYNCCTARSR